MPRTWAFRLCVPLASAALLIGCTQDVGEDRTENRTPIDGATNQTRQDLEIALTGCLATGPGTNQYVLTHVRPVPLATQPSDALSSANLNIEDNSAVRLISNDEQALTSLIGQTVEVNGLLRHDGRNTIGTSSAPVAPGDAGPRTDQSQAATDQHHSDKVRKEAGPIAERSMNNGTYPELTVQRVTATGEKCVTNRVEDRR